MEDDKYWELYDDQTSEGFGKLSYLNLQGQLVTAPVEDDLQAQVFNIRRMVGADTQIKLYAR